MRLAVLVLLLALPAAASAARIKVAVTEVRGVQGVAPGTGTILSDLIVSELARQGYEVISQSDIAAAVGVERQRQLLGCDEARCLAEAGNELGAEYLVTGQVGQLGSRYRVSLLVVDSRKARVVGRATSMLEQQEEALARSAETAVGQLIATIRASQTGLLPVPVPVPVPALAAAPPAREPGPATAGLAASVESGRHMTPGSWIALGGGGALALTGAVVLAQARSAGAHDREALAGVTVGAGAMAAGIGAWLYWRSDSAPVTVLPTATANGGGLLAAGRF
jgi:TolB-like protein